MLPTTLENSGKSVLLRYRTKATTIGYYNFHTLVGSVAKNPSDTTDTSIRSENRGSWHPEKPSEKPIGCYARGEQEEISTTEGLLLQIPQSIGADQVNKTPTRLYAGEQSKPQTKRGKTP